MIWQTDSLEARLKIIFFLFLSFQIGCCIFLLTVLPLWQVILLGLGNCILIAFLLRGLSNQLMAVFRRTSLQIEASQNEDYSYFSKPVFSKGKVAEFHQQVRVFGESLRQYKSNNDQQLIVLYRLIDQLNTPILVFNQKVQLNYANLAFIELFNQPWQTLRYSSPALLGLIKKNKWEFMDNTKAQKWQIRHSSFLEQGKSHQLLVFIDIQTALRESQVEAWQKLIRVLSHEIRNSLTPVAALTQNLHSKTTCSRTQKALEVIGERCKHLQDFVSRYSDLHKPLHLAPKQLKAQLLFEQVAGLFPNIVLRPRGLQLHLWVDAALLQQVLINLIKNAIEAGGTTGVIEIIFSQSEFHSEIQILDTGQGIANPDNLFVPFYSTKPHGQGIGLSLSRHIIEQMGGYLSLSNRVQGHGACAHIRLPRLTEGESPLLKN